MLGENSLREIIDRVSSTAKETFENKLESVILYGSYARGDFDGQSDIDIMVIADIEPCELGGVSSPFRRLCGELLYEYDTVVSVCVQDSRTYHRFVDTLPFFMNIKKEGVRVA